MYSASQRFWTIVGACLTLALAALPLIAFSSYLRKVREPEIAFNFNRITIYQGAEDYYVSKVVDLPELRFNLKADFSPLFHWNTKQLFVYVVLEYTTDEFIRNEIVIWDRIIRRTDSHVLALKNIKNKYPITDITGKLRGRWVNLKVCWNTVPNVGVLFDTSNGSQSFQMTTF